MEEGTTESKVTLERYGLFNDFSFQYASFEFASLIQLLALKIPFVTEIFSSSLPRRFTNNDYK